MSGQPAEEQRENGWLTLVAIVGLGVLIFTGNTYRPHDGPPPESQRPPVQLEAADVERPDNADKADALYHASVQRYMEGPDEPLPQPPRKKKKQKKHG